MTVGLHDSDGNKRLTYVAGTSYTGLYAADGSWNVVVDDNTYSGIYHPCGAYRVSSDISDTTLYTDDGAYRLSSQFLTPNIPTFVTSQWGELSAVIDLYADFQNEQYWIRGKGQVSLSDFLSVSRASNEIIADSTGALTSFSSGVAAISDNGLQIQEARTNKCTNYNANPTDTTNVTPSLSPGATLTVVDDVSALTTAGIQNIVSSGKVYKLDNSAAAGSSFAQFDGMVGNTNTHYISAYVRGSGTVTLRVGGVNNNFTLSSDYARKSASVTPGVTSDQMRIYISAGGIVYFILNQLEEGAFVTSPIVVAGSSAARAADIITLTGQAATKALAAKAAFFQTDGVASSPTSRNLLSGPTGSDGFIYYPGGFDARVHNQYNSLFAVALSGSGDVTGITKTAFGFDATSLTAVMNDGTLVTSVNPGSWNVSPIYFGNRAAGDRALNGYMQRFALSRTKGWFDASTS